MHERGRRFSRGLENTFHGCGECINQSHFKPDFVLVVENHIQDQPKIIARSEMKYYSQRLICYAKPNRNCREQRQQGDKQMNHINRIDQQHEWSSSCQRMVLSYRHGLARAFLSVIKLPNFPKLHCLPQEVHDWHLVCTFAHDPHWQQPVDETPSKYTWSPENSDRFIGFPFRKAVKRAPIIVGFHCDSCERST